MQEFELKGFFHSKGISSRRLQNMGGLGFRGWGTCMRRVLTVPQSPDTHQPVVTIEYGLGIL